MNKKFFVVLILMIFLCTSLFFGCSGASQKPIQIASKPMTEQFILTEMLKLVIEDNTDYTVNITKGVGGGTGNIQPAMEKGDFDLYPEYTSTAWQFVLDKKDIPPYDQLLKQLQEAYKKDYNFEWVGMYGFSDAFGLVVRNEIAKEHNLKTYSDLGAVSSALIFCAEPDFYERADGFDALCETYGLQFKEQKDMDIGLKYQAINAGQVDVMDIFTTDAALANSDVTVLEDDKHYFIDAYCGTVVRAETLEKYPGLREALMKMEGILSNDEMTQLNYLVENEKRDETEVAKEFLQSKGILNG